MKRGFVLQLARLMGLAPFCRETTAYFDSVGWRIYSVLLILLYNIVIISLVIWIYGFELAGESWATRGNDYLLVSINCCFIVTCLLAFAWGCVARQHSCLHLLLTQLAESRSSCPRREAFMLFHAVLTFLSQLFRTLKATSGHGILLTLIILGLQFFSAGLLPVTIAIVALFLRSIAKQHKLLNLQAKNVLSKRRNRPQRSGTSIDILLIRKSHLETSETLRELCFCVGPQLTVFLAFCVFTYVTTLNRLWKTLLHIPPRVGVTTFVFANNVLYVTAMLGTLIFTSEMAVSEGNKMRRLLRTALKSANLNKEEEEQIDRFASFLHVNRVEVSLSGVGAIDYKLFLKIFSTVATYLAILGQMQ